jgi:hypothetical protein
MVYFLLVGLVLESILTFVENFRAPAVNRWITLAEIVVVSIIGAMAFCWLLQVSVLPALGMGLTFSVINQIWKWFWGTPFASALAGFIEVIPPAFLVPVIFSGWFWYGALLAAIEWVAPLTVSAEVITGALINATIWFTIISWISVGIGFITRFNRDELARR